MNNYNILRFDISMNYIMWMKIGYSWQKTSHDKRSCFFTKLSVLHSRKQFSIATELFYKINIISITKYLIELDYVRMLNVTQNFNFSHQLSHETFSCDCFLFDRFETDYHSSGFMKCDGDLTELTLAYVFDNYKIVENRIIPQIFKIVFRFYWYRFLNLIRFSIRVCAPERWKYSFLRPRWRINGTLNRLLTIHNTRRSILVAYNKLSFLNWHGDYPLRFLIRLRWWWCYFQ